MTIIEVEELRKEFKIYKSKPGVFGALRSLLSGEAERKVAVDGVSFMIEAGECVGYIGPNGAGKSTTMKMLSGILHPTSGTISILGLSPDRHRKQLAYQFGIVFGQRTQLWWDLPLRDSYDILRRMYHLDGQGYRRFLEMYDSLLGIGAFLETPVRKLSLGQRMRADLAAALIHDPPILFLDEPTIGLDVVAKKRMREFLREIKEANRKTILLTTHDMEEIASLCDRVLVINHGKIVMDGSIEDLQKFIGLPSIIRVKFKERLNRTGMLRGARKWIVNGDELTIYYDRRETTVPILLKEAGGWGEMMDVQMVEPRIEDMIERIYALKKNHHMVTSGKGQRDQ
jgi:ABC-2 type transport system ATP-binding protein